jgi:hypothetical protein
VGPQRNKQENQEVPGINEYQMIANQNLWNIVETVLRRKFIAMNSYINNIERSKINYPMLHFKVKEKQE